MFQFPSFASLPNVVITGLQPAGLSHSEILGSKVICTYPRLIAAYHVLHRLREPRHPPCALSYFLRLPRGKRGDAAHTFSCLSDSIRGKEPPENAGLREETGSALQSCLCQYVKDLVLLLCVF